MPGWSSLPTANERLRGARDAGRRVASREEAGLDRPEGYGTTVQAVDGRRHDYVRVGIVPFPAPRERSIRKIRPEYTGRQYSG
jgi:hypothetical protein